MATSRILPRPRTLVVSPVLRHLAADLHALHAADPRFGVPFCRALTRVIDHAATAPGITYAPITDTDYRVQSASCAGLWYEVTPEQCSCAARDPWCWHRALVHLLTCEVLVPVGRREQPRAPRLLARDDTAAAPVPPPARPMPCLDHATLRRLAATDPAHIHDALTVAQPPTDVLAVLDVLAALLRPRRYEPITGPADVAAHLLVEMSSLEQEQFRVVCLDSRNCVQSITTLYQGTVSSATIRVGEVFREPVRRMSSSIIVAHNHPSGAVDPSPSDVALTREIVQAGKLLDIPVLDHLIIGQGRWTSLRKQRLGFGS